ncbi:hypothetical protein, partial [Chryseobacterium indoltheticum]|uniref:hypothetical protein n=1 Tax=Chryseobacterium indoltheticum TaxID=254 RepID=UPI003F49811E
MYFVQFYPVWCLTQVERSRIGVFAFIVKRFRVFHAPPPVKSMSFHPNGFATISPTSNLKLVLKPRK